jgi:ferrous-iron efflux pump FieF
MIYKDDEAPDHIASVRSHSLFAAYWALGTVLILVVIKTNAYYFSGSAALLASLTDTLGDGFISLITFASIRISLMPADKDHRFGHGKVEGFSAMLQASVLIGASVFLVFESGRRLLRPEQIDHHALGITVSVIAVILSVILIKVQQSAIEKTQSLAIEADQRHYMNDVLINGAVVIGLAFHYFTGMIWADSLLGFIIALYIGWTGYEVGRKAADMLMDREIEEEKRALIHSIVENFDGVFGMHDLRTRRSGMSIIISFDIELEPEQTLREAHAITREIEFALLEKFPNAEILIHKDPKGDTYDTRHKVQGVHH